MKPRSLLLPALVALVLAAAPAAAQGATTLQPGAYHETDAGSCTLNFVYTGNAKTYLGTAAHCVERVGQRVRDIEGTEFGSVAFIGDADTTEWDFAFIQVDSEDLSRVSPAVKGWPAYPKGSTVPSDTVAGDSIQLSGYGLGYGTTKTTQEQRTAVHAFDDTELYAVSGPIHWGDSGGPLVHKRTGKALGIVSRLCIGTCTEEGPTVQGILAKAAARGFAVSLRTV
ncbi:MAG TPA: trypsin-like peptidase domain-containing protein [Solirubrobacteraceae bacterium]|nr:trypsin-like peptidase domain-containing protein [Solirubrobacteraceae bacterium]